MKTNAFLHGFLSGYMHKEAGVGSAIIGAKAGIAGVKNKKEPEGRVFDSYVTQEDIEQNPVNDPKMPAHYTKGKPTVTAEDLAYKARKAEEAKGAEEAEKLVKKPENIEKKVQVAKEKTQEAASKGASKEDIKITSRPATGDGVNKSVVSNPPEAPATGTETPVPKQEVVTAGPNIKGIKDTLASVMARIKAATPGEQYGAGAGAGATIGGVLGNTMAPKGKKTMGTVTGAVAGAGLGTGVTYLARKLSEMQA